VIDQILHALIPIRLACEGQINFFVLVKNRQSFFSYMPATFNVTLKIQPALICKVTFKCEGQVCMAKLDLEAFGVACFASRN
jgi:hypothetical protein